MIWDTARPIAIETLRNNQKQPIIIKGSRDVTRRGPISSPVIGGFLLCVLSATEAQRRRGFGHKNVEKTPNTPEG